MGRPRKNPEFITKICEGCKKEFTISSRKYRQRYCTKHCVQHDPKVIDKMKKSQQEKWDLDYQGNHPMKTENTKNNFKKSIFEKYGNDYFSNYLVKETKKTKLERYGDENYNNIDQIKKTCLERYGIETVISSKYIKNKISDTILKKHFKFIEEYSKNRNILPLFKEKDYKGYLYQNKYEFKCNTCNYHFKTDVYKPHHIICEKCNPSDIDTLENDIFNFIYSILPENTIIKRNDRTILYGKELDIYIPSYKFAIEINGLYWHSEIGRGIKRFYHNNKSKNCIFHGIKLIHIFENEWIHKKDIVKSILKNLLTNDTKKIYGRNCIIQEVTKEEKQIFLNENHIQGDDLSIVKIGLYENDKLLSIMTFGKSRFDKKVEWEIIRYCNLLNVSVIGGASKLLNYFIKTYNPNSIISYSDRRYFDGLVYNTIGFKFINNTSPNYFYINKNYKTLYSRMMFQKHKLSKLLENFDPSLSEWQNMKNHGFDRIWDCGHSKWIWLNSSNSNVSLCL